MFADNFKLLFSFKAVYFIRAKKILNLKPPPHPNFPKRLNGF